MMTRCFEHPTSVRIPAERTRLHSTVTCLSTRLAWRPFQITATQQVQMKMKHGLPGTGSYVVHSAITVFHAAFTRDPGSDQVRISDDLGVFRTGLFQSDDVLFGNDEHVGRRLRPKVLKGKNLFVLVNFLGGNFSGDDIAEKAG